MHAQDQSRRTARLSFGSYLVIHPLQLRRWTIVVADCKMWGVSQI